MAPTATSTASTTTATSAAAAAAATSSASTSSIPTSLEEATQRYHSTKLTLRTGLANKRLIDRSLIDLESQIYLFEGSYLQTTSSSGGNIVKGFDSYLKNSSSSSTSRGGNQGSLGAEVPVEDRIFSLSSATYQKSLELKANEGLLDEEPSRTELESDTSATPVVKKKKDKEPQSSGKEVKKKKDKERSQTPQVGKTGGKNADAGANATTAGGSTPTKTTTGGGGGKASSAGAGGGTATKLKRKNTDGAAAAGSSGASTPSGKAVKRKKDDD